MCHLLTSLLADSRSAVSPLDSSAMSTAIFKSSIHFSISDSELQEIRDLNVFEPSIIYAPLTLLHPKEAVLDRSTENVLCLNNGHS